MKIVQQLSAANQELDDLKRQLVSIFWNISIDNVPIGLVIEVDLREYFLNTYWSKTIERILDG